MSFRVLAVSPDVALATDRTGSSLRGSVWRREGDDWRIVFHQGTPDHHRHLKADGSARRLPNGGEQSRTPDRGDLEFGEDG